MIKLWIFHGLCNHMDPHCKTLVAWNNPWRFRKIEETFLNLQCECRYTELIHPRCLVNKVSCRLRILLLRFVLLWNYCCRYLFDLGVLLFGWCCNMIEFQTVFWVDCFILINLSQQVQFIHFGLLTKYLVFIKNSWTDDLQLLKV